MQNRISIVSGNWFPSVLHCQQAMLYNKEYSMASLLPWGGCTVLKGASAPVQKQKQDASMVNISALEQHCPTGWPHVLYLFFSAKLPMVVTQKPHFGHGARCTPAESSTCARAEILTPFVIAVL